MNSDKWISAWCSVIGSSHISEDLPCQDNSKVEYLNDSDIVIAAISDGAGSCKNSQLGSAFLVDKSIEKVASLFKIKDFFVDSKNKLTYEIWRRESQQIFKELKGDLNEMSNEMNIDFKTLSATLIIAVSSGKFIACSNIGDGRAAYRNLQEEWIQMLIPTKGEEANQTIFITSDLWEMEEERYFSSFYLDSPITGFTILSDGCERASFEILKYNEEQGKYYDPNRPYKPFFEPVFLNLLKLKEANIDQDKINELWQSFIERGNQKLISETDDKSMILAAYLLDNENEAHL